MEIIKHGKEYYTKTCDKCGCEFSFYGAEVKSDRKDFYSCKWHQVKIVKTIDCPECGEIIVLSDNQFAIKDN